MLLIKPGLHMTAPALSLHQHHPWRRVLRQKTFWPTPRQPQKHFWTTHSWRVQSTLQCGPLYWLQGEVNLKSLSMTRCLPVGDQSANCLNRLEVSQAAAFAANMFYWALLSFDGVLKFCSNFQVVSCARSSAGVLEKDWVSHRCLWALGIEKKIPLIKP